MSEPANILFVDDDDSFRCIMGRELKRMGFAVELLSSADGLRERVRQEAPDAIVLDLKMPGKQGLDVLVELLAENCSLQVIVLTGHGSVTEAVEAMRSRPHGCWPRTVVCAGRRSSAAATGPRCRVLRRAASKSRSNASARSRRAR
jgi:CheY-like chemotaxis protein